MISIIIVAFNPGPEIAECIASAKMIDDAEVIIWDNSERPGQAPALAGAIEGCTILGDGTNYGFGRANNLAAAQASADSRYLLFLNPDCVLTPETAYQLRMALEADPSVGAVAPMMAYVDGGYGISGGPFPTIAKEVASDLGIYRRLPKSLKNFALATYDRLFAQGRSGFSTSVSVGETTYVDWVSGFCLMAGTEDFSNVGGFSDRYFLYFEDVDLCRRIANAGKKSALVRSALALHYESTSTDAPNSPGKAVHYSNGREAYFNLYGGKVSGWGARVLRARAHRRARRAGL